jgi:hypothetical protein
MSFWNEENYKVRLADFVERFVPHNRLIRLYKRVRLKDDGKWELEYFLLWRGMDWQVTEGYADSDYFKHHQDVEPCPYSEHNVVSVTSVGISGEFADEVSLVIEVE